MASDLIRKRIKYAGDVHKELLKAGWPLEVATDFVNNIPDVDAVEVVHGVWEVCEDDWNEEVTYKCSNCGDELVTLCGFEIDWNYCPNCGAKMDGEEM